MKRLLEALLALMLIFSLAACGDDGGDADTDADAPAGAVEEGDNGDNGELGVPEEEEDTEAEG